MKVRFAAALLAGGKSRRMGRDKALLPVDWEGDSVPLWRRQLSLLEALGPSQFFISGARKSAYPSSCVVLSDAWNDAGPLGGIATCLQHTAVDLLLVIAVDVPKVQPEFLQKLLKQAHPGQGVVPVLQGRFEPLVAIYPKDAFRVALAQLARNDFVLQNFITELEKNGLMTSYQVAPAEQEQLENWNTPEDLRS